ncbi:hypothetical protein B7463_g4741, partial [Scytalidium lignicola]
MKSVAVFILAGGFTLTAASQFHPFPSRLLGRQSTAYNGTNNVSAPALFPLSTDDYFSFYFTEILALANGGGSATSEVLRAVSQILPGDYESVYNEFNYLADAIHDVARSVNVTKNPVSAREAYFRASSYYRAAEFFLHGNISDPRIYTLWDSVLTDFDIAISLLDIPGERVNVSAMSENGTKFTVPITFYKAHNDCTKAPTLLVGNGYDAAQEDSYHYIGLGALSRGWNVATYEGPPPAHGPPPAATGLYSGLVERRNSSSVVPHLARRCGLFTHCLNGNILRRLAGAAGREQGAPSRGQPSMIDSFIEGNVTAFDTLWNELEVLPSVPTDLRWLIAQSKWSFNTNSPSDWLTQLNQFALTPDVAKAINVPVFLAKAQNDTLTLTQPEQAEAVFTQAGKNTTFHEFTTVLGAGEHCSLGAEPQLAQVIFDWLYVVGVGPGIRLEGQPIASQKAVVFRGTACYRGRRNKSTDWEYVVKFAWPSDKRQREGRLLKLATERRVTGIAQWFHHEQISIDGSLDTIASLQNERNAEQNAEQNVKEDESHKSDVLSIQEPDLDTAQPLHAYKSVIELLEVFRDVIAGHRSLLEDGKILHREISENNIIITKPAAEGGPKRRLIDLDLTKELDSTPSGASHRTGTIQFMSIRSLNRIYFTLRILIDITMAFRLSGILWASLVISTSAVVFDQTIDLSLLGPIYLPAANRNFQAWDDAKTQAAAALNKIIQTGNSTYGPLDNKGTSFSTSVFDLICNEPLFDFHFEAPELIGSYTKGKLTDNTVYRTGSLGKLLVMYAWMVDIGDSIFTDPITKYISKLDDASYSYENPLLQTKWGEVTIGSLASQISGIGRDVSIGDIALEESMLDDILSGFPPLPNDTIINCSAMGHNPPAQDHVSNMLPTNDPQAKFEPRELLAEVISHPPVFPSYTSPTYSNMAYILLGFAYENITGKSINQGQLDFAQILGMNSTTPTPPGDNVDAIIPRNNTYAQWNYDGGIQDPAGGQFTSTKDLITWGQVILTNKLISPVMTRRWMKPITFTSQWEAAVGAPWEIYRLPIPVNTIVNTSRLLDSYCKSRDIGRYSTFFCLIPDYNIGITVMAAGDNPHPQVQPIRGTLVDIFYNAAEAASKHQAKNAFTGTFKSTNLNSSITLAVDGGPGIVIKQWISNGTDFLTSQLYAAYDDFRLYPTELKIQGFDSLTYYKFHMEALAQNGIPYGGDPWDGSNDYWFQLDSTSYNVLSPDAFVVGFDQDGMVQKLASQALRTAMVRST